MYAIMNTVDTIDGWPQRGVHLFESEAEAMAFAVRTIKAKFPDDLVHLSDEDVLNEFQSSLCMIEYFHIEKVIEHS